MGIVRKTIREALDNTSSGNVNRLERMAKKFGYVSFDIFDTLIKRDVPNPSDVFEIVGGHIGVDDFKNLRISAEKKARMNSESGEVSLKDIYDNLFENDPDLRNKALSEELAVEKNISVANPDLIDFYNRIKESTKIILISDMYLDSTVIVDILDYCGICGYSKIYISNEFDKTKRSGELYKLVLKDLDISPSEILHIGNSFVGDYFMARKNKISSFKVRTEVNRLSRKNKNVLCSDNKKKQYLDAFINNHINSNSDYYFRFGYECMGPLLYGFINWLNEDMKKEDIDQVLFLSRDGFIMEKVYKELGYGEFIPDYYFEASRRSLRIPSFNRSMTYEDILKEMTLPNKTNIAQIVDSWGLDVNEIEDILNSKNINAYEYIERNKLIDNQIVKGLFSQLFDKIMDNAEKEREMLVGYLGRFDFSLKTAIVDIGWRGSMQKYLTRTLSLYGNENCQLYGYYIGLRETAVDVLGKHNLNAKGYAFDCLNNSSDNSMERAFLGLIETPFLEQSGSVKRYVQRNNQFFAERYPYEFSESDGSLSQEAKCVNQIQNGAIEFAKDYKRSLLCDFVGNASSVMFSNFYELGINPSIKDVKAFGDFNYFDNGESFKLAKPSVAFSYIFNISRLKRDLFDSRWKIGFLKGLIKLPIRYIKLFDMLVRKK